MWEDLYCYNASPTNHFGHCKMLDYVLTQCKNSKRATKLFVCRFLLLARDCVSMHASAPAHAHGSVTLHRPIMSTCANCWTIRLGRAACCTRVAKRPALQAGRLLSRVGRPVVHEPITGQLHWRTQASADVPDNTRVPNWSKSSADCCAACIGRTVAQYHWPTLSVSQSNCKRGKKENWNFFSW